MKDAYGILMAVGLVRLFWDGVMKFSAFYQRYRLPPREHLRDDAR